MQNNKKIWLLMTAAVLIWNMGIIAYAVESSAESSLESSAENSLESSFESSVSSTDQSSSNEETSTSIIDSSYEDASSASSSVEETISSVVSNDETHHSAEEVSSEESSSSVSEESSRSEENSQVSEIFETDPFGWINHLETVLPADKENYISPKQQSDAKLLEESERAAAAALLSAPPMPYEETSFNTLGELETIHHDDTSFITGIIIWSVIGVMIAITIIFLFHSNTKGAARRKRYKKYRGNFVMRKGSRRIKSKYLK